MDEHAAIVTMVLKHLSGEHDQSGHASAVRVKRLESTLKRMSGPGGVPRGRAEWAAVTPGQARKIIESSKGMSKADWDRLWDVAHSSIHVRKSAIDLVEKTIVKRGSQWFVYSKDKSKKLSRGYPSRRAAVRRLQQIEFFKHQHKSLSEDSISKMIDAGDLRVDDATLKSFVAKHLEGKHDQRSHAWNASNAIKSVMTDSMSSGSALATLKNAKSHLQDLIGMADLSKDEATSASSVMETVDSAIKQLKSGNALSKDDLSKLSSSVSVAFGLSGTTVGREHAVATSSANAPGYKRHKSTALHADTGVVTEAELAQRDKDIRGRHPAWSPDADDESAKEAVEVERKRFVGEKSTALHADTGVMTEAELAKRDKDPRGMHVAYSPDADAGLEEGDEVEVARKKYVEAKSQFDEVVKHLEGQHDQAAHAGAKSPAGVVAHTPSQLHHAAAVNYAKEHDVSIRQALKKVSRTKVPGAKLVESQAEAQGKPAKEKLLEERDWESGVKNETLKARKGKMIAIFNRGDKFESTLKMSGSGRILGTKEHKTLDEAKKFADDYFEHTDFSQEVGKFDKYLHPFDLYEPTEGKAQMSPDEFRRRKGLERAVDTEKAATAAG